MNRLKEAFDSFRNSECLVKVIAFIALLLHTLTSSTITPLFPAMLIRVSASNVSDGVGFKASDIYNASDVTKADDYNGALGYIVSTRWIVDFVFTLLTGFIVDKFGTRWPMLVGVFFEMAAILGYAFVPNLASLLVCRAIHGIGASLTYVSCLALISETFQDATKRNKALSEAFIGYSIGLLLGYAVGPILFRFSNLSTPFLVLAALAFIDLVLRFLRPAETKPRPKVSNIHISKCVVLLSDPYIMVCLSCNFSMFFGIGIYLATGADWMIHDLKADMWQIGVVLFISLLFMILGDLLAGWFSLKHQWAWLLAAMWFYSLGMIIYPEFDTIWWVIVSEGVARFGIGIELCCINSLLARVTDIRFDSASYGATFALFSATVDLGFILGSLFGGFMVPVMTFAWLYRFEGIFVFVTSFGALIYRKIPTAQKETLDDDYEEILESSDE